MLSKNRILSTVSLYHALNDGSVSIISILFPIFKSNFDLNYTEIGIITATGLLISIIAQLLIGRASDGKNFRTLLSFGILLISISLLLLTKSRGFLSLIFFIVLLRISSSFFHPIGTGWISRTFKKDRLDWAMGIQSGFADIGVFIAISTTLFLTEIKGWEFPLYLWSVSAAVIVLLGIFQTMNIEEELLLVKKENKKQSIRESIHEAFLLFKRIKILIPAFMISGAGWGIVITYFPLLLDEKTNIPLSFIGILISIWIGVGCISSFYYGRIKSFLGRKNTLIISYFIIGLSSIFLSLFIELFVIIFVLALLGFSLFITFPALASFISEGTHETAEGKTFGLIFTLQLGGGTLLLFLGGYIADVFGIWTPFFLLGFLSIILSLVLVLNYSKSFVSEIQQ